MNKEFEKYDKDCQRTIYITVDAFNKLLAQADAGVTFLHRDEALYGKYEACLDSCEQGYETPLSMEMYEARYFTEKCSSITEDNKPAYASICKALGLRSIACEWAKDSYGRQLNDELEVRYRI